MRLSESKLDFTRCIASVSILSKTKNDHWKDAGVVERGGLENR